MSSSSSGPPWHQNVLGTHPTTLCVHDLVCAESIFFIMLNAGNATDALVYIFSAILIFTVLSGKWWILLYLVVGVVIFCVILLYTFYVSAELRLNHMLSPSHQAVFSIACSVWLLQLEYNAQEYLEMQHKLARKRPRLGRVE